MLFSSLIFLFFFLPVVLIVYYAVLHKRWTRNLWLTIMSLFFYAWGEPRFVFVMVFSVVLNYAWGLLVSYFSAKQKDKAGKLILAATVFSNMLLLGYYKYAGFLIANLNLLGGNFTIPQIALPIGISFFTFQAMSYVFDVYRKSVSVQRNPLDLILYVSFFPQLIAGPIVRYETVAAQIANRTESFDSVSMGVRRFVEGLAKKVLLSNQLALIADKAFGMGDYTGLSASLAWLGAVCYALQIYYDFSGYSDMAIGLGKMFGFSFYENFDYPYISKSVSEFWRRWHISLGTWFRDYVYFPLGGSRVKTKGRLVLNLFVVWLLTGVWHGASWNFILWGLMYFAWIAFEKLCNIPGRLVHPISKVLYQSITLVVVLFGWVLFRADGLHNAVSYLLSMAGVYGSVESDSLALVLLGENLIFLLMGLLTATPFFHRLVSLVNKCVCQVSEKAGAVMQVGGTVTYHLLLLVLFAVVVSYLAKGSYNPFIYFNF